MLDFLIIGAQKSASTYLHRCMASHPQVFLPEEEIRTFEDPDYSRETLHELERLVARGQGRKVGIKRPDYLSRPEVPARIHSFSPKARLIVTLRNPVERAVSAYYHLVKLGFVPVIPLNEGLPQLLDGSLARDWPKAAEILEYGLYFKHLKHFQEYFNQEQFLVLIDSDIKYHPDASLTRAFAHIGLTGEDQRPLPGRSNPGVYSIPRLKFLNLRNRWVFDYRENHTRLYRKKGLGPFVNTAIAGFDRLVLSRVLPNTPQTPDPKLRDQLCSFYRDDIQALSKMLGRDLSPWLAGRQPGGEEGRVA